ncbi:amino acid ABC transporter substrate-binding protein [Trinickia terrae]|uniref:Amino acid ABC transporter substrate-binding protein n=2 Tax=Trinickia terrae TaxID=2571161 RepID=A0A4U1IDT2_9BURK|nr:amino acid ABC transporter substrate-binding protein [Trinickia terrae]
MPSNTTRRFLYSALTLAGVVLSCPAHAADSYAFGSCKPTGKPNSVSLTTLDKDTLTVATVLPNPGWWNGTSPNTIEGGFEYCLAADIAYRAGLHHVKIRNMAWDQYISGTATGYDIALSSTTITDARKRIFNFSRPYFSSNLGVAIRASADVTEGNIRTKRIGVLQGNVGAEWVAHTLKPKAVSVYQSQTDMFTALVAGQVGAVITDTTLALSQIKESNGALRVTGQYALNQGYGVITPRGSANTDAVDKVVGELVTDGSVQQLSTTYLQPMFGVDPNAVPVWSVK